MSLLLSSVKKTKVVLILGATGTGKSKLAISLATHFSGEIINSDKIQVYDAIPVITNRVSVSELSAAPHHLLAFLPSNADFSAADFIKLTLDNISSIASHDHLPIIAGGSNSYIKALVEDPDFRARHDSCFISLYADSSVLDPFVSARVDTMIKQGLIEEARSLFDPENSDYSRGVRRAIGVPELDEYFRALSVGRYDEEKLNAMFQEAVKNIKENTRKLMRNQENKITRLSEIEGLNIHHANVSEFFTMKLAGFQNDAEEEGVWERVVGIPCREIVKEFLNTHESNTTKDAFGGEEIELATLGGVREEENLGKD